MSAPETTTPTTETALSVEGMNCASCVEHVRKAAANMPGVESCQVNLAAGRAVVRFDPARTDPQRIAAAITASGYDASPQTMADAAGQEERLRKHRAHAQSWLSRAVAGMVLWLPVEIAHWIERAAAGAGAAGHAHSLAMIWISLATSTLAIVYVGSAFYVSAWRALRLKTSNMDTLIAMGASVAYGYSLAALIGWLAGRWELPRDIYFMESTGLLALISTGHWLEARARDAAGSAIRKLLDLSPSLAWRIDDDGQAVQVPVAQIAVGQRVLIRPGDRIAVDGVVVDGQSDVDEAMITGEPTPALRTIGDAVIAGTLNQGGRLVAKATQVGSETALAQIVHLVETAQGAKPPVQHLADRIAAMFVPAVLGVALLTGLGWWMWGQGHGWPATATWGAIAKAVCSVLIIACPCALGLALPAALMVGAGRGAQHGILIRDIDALQNASTIDTVVFDKTGTITIGKPRVTELRPAAGVAERELLRLAAAAERYSEHPLAKAIVLRAGEAGIELPQPRSFQNHAGGGVEAGVDDQTVVVGSASFAGQEDNFQPPDGQSLVHVALKNADGSWRAVGQIVVGDRIKPEAAVALAELHAMGLRTMLLTGDTPQAAAAIAAQAGIDQFQAQVKPQQKAQAIAQLQTLTLGADQPNDSRQVRRRVAMVGDGINDAPALAQADLGIALGSGSDIAKETGGIVLVGASLHSIASAIRLSRATMRTIRQNLFFAFAYNVLAIPLAALGCLNPLIAAAAMALSDLTVVGNALLLRRKKI